MNANVVTKEDANSNLNGVATAAVVNNDDIDNVKSPTGYENSIGDLDGIKDKYYQVKGKYGSIYGRSDDINPPPLSPESPAYIINIQYIHSSIPNDGEKIVLPSSVS